MRKKGLPEILVKAAMSLYEDSKTKVKVGSEFLREFNIAVGVRLGSVLSPLLFAIVVNIVTDNARESLIKEVFYADDLVVMSETDRESEEKIF